MSPAKKAVNRQLRTITAGVHVVYAPFPLTVTGVTVVARVARDGEATAEAARAPARAANVVVFMFEKCVEVELLRLSRYFG